VFTSSGLSRLQPSRTPSATALALTFRSAVARAVFSSFFRTWSECRLPVPPRRTIATAKYLSRKAHLYFNPALMNFPLTGWLDRGVWGGHSCPPPLTLVLGHRLLRVSNSFAEVKQMQNPSQKRRTGVSAPHLIAARRLLSISCSLRRGVWRILRSSWPSRRRDHRAPCYYVMAYVEVLVFGEGKIFICEPGSCTVGPRRFWTLSSRHRTERRRKLRRGLLLK